MIRSVAGVAGKLIVTTASKSVRGLYKCIQRREVVGYHGAAQAGVVIRDAGNDRMATRFLSMVMAEHDISPRGGIAGCHDNSPTSETGKFESIWRDRYASKPNGQTFASPPKQTVMHVNSSMACNTRQERQGSAEKPILSSLSLKLVSALFNQ